MNSNGSTSLVELEAERTKLRLECQMLFDKKRAIEMQMEEIHTRLQCLDDEIDAAGVREEEDEVLSRGGKRKFSMTMPTQQDEPTEESEMKVKFEVVDENIDKNDRKKSLARNSMSLTQPEEYLTDPHTQPEEEYLADPSQWIDANDNDNIDCGTGEIRRISTSPPEEARATRENEQSMNGMFQSNTPPGLKRSAPTTSSVMNPYANSSPASNVKNPYANTSPSTSSVKNPHTKGAVDRRGSNASNPFQDLWNSNESTSHLNVQSSNISGKGSTSVNTLEKYLVPAQSSNSVGENPGDANAGQKQSDNDRKHEASGSVQNNARYQWSDRMMYHLQKTFSISQFRGHQEEIINATMQGEDAFVVMRTGGGKSLTYQLPSVLESEGRERKVTIVISPLISLIRDQEEQMNQMRPNSAVSFTSSMAGGTSEHARRWALVRDPTAGVALIFVTPEKVGKSSKFKNEMEKLNKQGRLGRFVVDECHCACQWGHDFRPDYTKLGILKHHFPSVPLLAVTVSFQAQHLSD
mmetsp:Transcript_25728/g.53748  ORF Transcript_25728/g.53748 Transcript_25728/m.53748 type:complete len:523 (-) Transcript_25728:1797-3365(-)